MVRSPWMGYRPIVKVLLLRTTLKYDNIHAPNKIRTPCPHVRKVKDGRNIRLSGPLLIVSLESLISNRCFCILLQACLSYAPDVLS